MLLITPLGSAQSCCSTLRSHVPVFCVSGKFESLCHLSQLSSVCLDRNGMRSFSSSSSSLMNSHWSLWSVSSTKQFRTHWFPTFLWSYTIMTKLSSCASDWDRFYDTSWCHNTHRTLRKYRSLWKRFLCSCGFGLVNRTTLLATRLLSCTFENK